MVHEVIVPSMGVNDQRVLVAAHLVEAGVVVARGEAIAAMETSKAAVDLESDESGVLAWVVDEGAEVDVLSCVAVVAASAEAAEAGAEVVRARHRAASEGGRVTRKAARRAAELGVAMDAVLSSVSGVVRVADVERFASLASESASPQPATLVPVIATRIAILNATGGGLAVVEAARSAGIEVVCLIDDVVSQTQDRVLGVPVVTRAAFETGQRADVDAVFVHLQKDRKQRVVREFAASGLPSPTLVHASAVVSPSAQIGPGALVKAGAVVDTNVRLGAHCIVDNGVIVAHDCDIGAYAHLAPGVALGGGVVIGRGAVLGVGACVASDLEIGREAVLLPGAHARSSVPAFSVVDATGAIVGRTKQLLEDDDS